MKQEDLEKETDDEQLDEQRVDGEQCDGMSSEKANKKRKRNQLKVYYIYFPCLNNKHTDLFVLVD